MKKLCAVLGLCLFLLGVGNAHAANISETLTWNDNSNNEDGFTIEQSNAPTGTFTTIGQTLANITTFTQSALTPNTQYCYRVAAFNSVGQSGYSNVACVTTPSVPASPSGLTVIVTLTP